MLKHLKFPFLLSLFVVGCSQPAPKEDNSQEFNFIDYKTVKLTTDLSKLADHEKQMIPLMIEAAEIMDELFWYESYGKGDSLLSAVNDEKLKKYIRINYGPWDRLQGFQSFIPGIGVKNPPEQISTLPTSPNKNSKLSKVLTNKASIPF